MDKWVKRDKKRNKKKYGMRVKGRSLITIQKSLAQRGKTK